MLHTLRIERIGHHLDTAGQVVAAPKRFALLLSHGIWIVSEDARCLAGQVDL